MDIISIQYRFTLPDLKEEIFDLHLDAESLELITNIPINELPFWTELTFHQCSNCTLTTETYLYCPLAVNISSITSRFDRLLSYDEIRLVVTTKERTVCQTTAAQRAVSSLFGLVIANSGCPHTAFFKPMARFHLPLANSRETLYRAASMYLLAQYFLKQDGREATLELDGLKKIYEEIHCVNTSIAERLQAISHSDLSANAVILLDVYAMSFPYMLESTLKNIRDLFRPFLAEMAHQHPKR